jgi:hypothetical protein
MIRRDWFESQLEAVEQALAAALGLKTKSELDAAAEQVEGSIHKAFGMSPKLALGLPLEEFLSFALRGEKPTAELLAELSRVFAEWAAFLRVQGDAGKAATAQARADELGALQY